jgi:RimJ/RimL family protein N-acetyltransferase
MHVVALRQLDRLRPFLWADRFFADYALGDLDPAHFQLADWFGAEEAGELCAVVMVYHDLQPPILFATGDGRGIELILDGMLRPPQIELSIREEHLPIIEEFYQARTIPMLKMALVPDDFQPAYQWSLRAQSAKQSSAAKDEIASSQTALTCPALLGGVAMTKLDVSHMPLLEELYAHGGGDAFRQRSLELGVFYGVFDNEHLVSVAGTHIVSDQERIAALGNVMTHPAYRGHGLATAATHAVCDELLDRGIQLIGLSVGRFNQAAQRVYEKIGFKRHIPFYEGWATLKLDK